MAPESLVGGIIHALSTCSYVQAHKPFSSPCKNPPNPPSPSHSTYRVGLPPWDPRTQVGGDSLACGGGRGGGGTQFRRLERNSLFIRYSHFSELCKVDQRTGMSNLVTNRKNQFSMHITTYFDKFCRLLGIRDWNHVYPYVQYSSVFMR